MGYYSILTCFFLNDTAPTEIYTLSLHDALPIFTIAFPMMISMSVFEEFYRDLLGSDGAFDAYRLLQGLDNKTVETGRELWRLSRQALKMPQVRKVLEEESAADVVPALEASAEGREFLAQLDAYLDE